MKDNENEIAKLLSTEQAIMDGLKIAPKDLTPGQSDTLLELAGLNQKATEIGKSFAQNLESGIGSWLGAFTTNIKPLSEEFQEKASKIFEQTLLNSVSQVTDNLYKGIKEGKGLLFNSMLSDNVVSAMESILNFKKQIDKDFPGLSDTLLAAAGMAITGIVSAYAPAAGVILKTTGIMDKAADFFKTENLETTVHALKAGLAEIGKDQELAKMQATGIKLAELSDQAHIPSNKLQKIGLNLETLKMLESEVMKTPSTKEFLGKVSSYAADVLPISKEDILGNLDQVKQIVIDTLRHHNIPSKIIENAQKVLDTELAKAGKIMETSLDIKAGFFDKVAAQQDAARMVMDIGKDINALLAQTPGKDSALGDVSSKLQSIMKDKVQLKEITELESEMKKLPPATQKSVKEALGSSFSNQVAIQRGIERLEKRDKGVEM